MRSLSTARRFTWTENSPEIYRDGFCGARLIDRLPASGLRSLNSRVAAIRENVAPSPRERLYRNTRNGIDVMLSNAKHLAFSGCAKDEILRLRLIYDITTQPLSRGRELQIDSRPIFATLLALMISGGIE